MIMYIAYILKSDKQFSMLSLFSFSQDHLKNGVLCWARNKYFHHISDIYHIFQVHI